MSTSVPFGQAGAAREAEIEEQQLEEEHLRRDYLLTAAARAHDAASAGGNGATSQLGSFGEALAAALQAHVGRGIPDPVEEEEEEEDGPVVLAPYGSMEPRDSKAAKQAYGLLHFDHYLKHHREAPWADHTQVPYENLNHDLIEGFMNYLGKDAHQRRNPALPLLMFHSATGYASSVKTYYCTVLYKDRPTPPVFEQAKWHTLRKDLCKMVVDRVKAEGSKLANSKAAATLEDIAQMALLCLWLGNGRAAEFLAIQSSMVTFSGRGSEVAGMRKDHLTAQFHSEQYMDYTRVKQFIHRHKTSVEQDCASYPHRVSLFVTLCKVPSKTLCKVFS